MTTLTSYILHYRNGIKHWPKIQHFGFMFAELHSDWLNSKLIILNIETNKSGLSRVHPTGQTQPLNPFQVGLLLVSKEICYLWPTTQCPPIRQAQFAFFHLRMAALSRCLWFVLTQRWISGRSGSAVMNVRIVRHHHRCESIFGSWHHRKKKSLVTLRLLSWDSRGNPN